MLSFVTGRVSCNPGVSQHAARHNGKSTEERRFDGVRPAKVPLDFEISSRGLAELAIEHHKITEGSFDVGWDSAFVGCLQSWRAGMARPRLPLTELLKASDFDFCFVSGTHSSFDPDSRHYMVPFKKADQAPSGPVSVSRKRPNHANPSSQPTWQPSHRRRLVCVVLKHGYHGLAACSTTAVVDTSRRSV